VATLEESSGQLLLCWRAVLACCDQNRAQGAIVYWKLRGPGDAFSGGFAVGLFEGMDIVTAARFG